jgi:hypothetical protein
MSSNGIEQEQAHFTPGRNEELGFLKFDREMSFGKSITSSVGDTHNAENDSQSNTNEFALDVLFLDERHVCCLWLRPSALVLVSCLSSESFDCCFSSSYSLIP